MKNHFTFSWDLTICYNIQKDEYPQDDVTLNVSDISFAEVGSLERIFTIFHIFLSVDCLPLLCHIFCLQEVPKHVLRLQARCKVAIFWR